MIVDTTLREGLQAHGVQPPLAVQSELARRLAKAGIGEIEVGCAGRSEHLEALSRTVRRAGSRALVWCPCRPDSVAAAPHGADVLCLSLPASDRHLTTRLRIDRETALARLRDTVRLARSRFAKVHLGLEDATRSDPDFLVRLAAGAAEAGVARVRLADTLGLLDPASTAGLFRWIRRSVTGLEFSFHGHDDFGMATANALAALDGGAVAADASLLGLGERAGIAATEEMAGWFALRRGETRWKPRELVLAARYLSRRAGVTIPERKALAGARIFRCESGLHVDGIQRDPSLYEPFAPEAVASRRRLDIGAKTGRAALRGALRELGLPEPPDLERLVGDVRRRSERLGRPLRPSELRRLCTRA